MQDDREIRAREGQSNLRTNKNYNNTNTDEVVQAQPVQISPMRYLPPLPASENGGSLSSSSHESREEIPELGGLAKNRVGSKVSQHNPIYFPFCHLFRTDSPRWSSSASKKLHKSQPSMVEQAELLSNVLEKQNGISNKEGADNNLHKQGRVSSGDVVGSAVNSDYHDAVAAYSSIFKGNDTTARDTNQKLLQSRLNSYDIRSLSRYDRANYDVVDVDNALDPRLKSHNLVDCTTIDVGKSGVNGEFQHNLAACPSSLSTTVGTQEHSLSQDQITRRSTISELSYVHDFADCPIDGKFLKYIEREERKSQRAGLKSISDASSGTRKTNRPYTHGRTDCIAAETEAGNSNQLSAMTRTHRLASCPIQWYGSFDKPMLRQHRILSCPTACKRGSSQIGLVSHRLSEESKECEPGGPLEHGLSEHRLSQCDPIGSAEDGKRILGQLPEHDITHSEPELETEVNKESVTKADEEDASHHRSRHSGRQSRKSSVPSMHNTWAGRKAPKSKKGLQHHKSTEPLTAVEQYGTCEKGIAVHFALASPTTCKAIRQVQRKQSQSEAADSPPAVLPIYIELPDKAAGDNANDARIAHDRKSANDHAADSIQGTVETELKHDREIDSRSEQGRLSEEKNIANHQASSQVQKRSALPRAGSLSAGSQSYDRKSSFDLAANGALSMTQPKITRTNSVGALCRSDSSQNLVEEKKYRPLMQKSSTIDGPFVFENKRSTYYNLASAREADKTAQHALAQCLAVDADRKASKKGMPEVTIAGTDGASDFKHRPRPTKSEESSPTFTLDEKQLERLRVYSEGEPAVKQLGKTWGWFEGLFS